MKQKTFFLPALIFVAFIYSCKKDEDTDQGATTPPPTASYPNYSQLKVGNYWIYQQFDIDANGIATPTNTYDSCYIEKDSILNGVTYFKLVKPKPYLTNQIDISFQRDSLHYNVDSNGSILFSSQDFTTVFASHYILTGANDTVCLITKQMADINLSVITPAGTYTTSNAKESYSMYPNWSAAGNPRSMHMRYAENIGVVIETLPFFASSPNYIERRLVRYHLN